MARRTSGRSRPSPRPARSVTSSPPGGDPIRHVVVLALENRSFDQMLGAFKAIYPRMEGVDPLHPGENTSLSGEVYRQRLITQTITLADPKHDHEAVMQQLEAGNNGFVRNYEENYPEMDRFPEEKHEKLRQIMGYFPLDVLPATHLLARHFTICDYWFSSVPGPTWVNRLFLLSGTSQGRVNLKAFENSTSTATPKTRSSIASTRRVCRGGSTTATFRSRCSSSTNVAGRREKDCATSTISNATRGALRRISRPLCSSSRTTSGRTLTTTTRRTT